MVYNYSSAMQTASGAAGVQTAPSPLGVGTSMAGPRPASTPITVQPVPMPYGQAYANLPALMSLGLSPNSGQVSAPQLISPKPGVGVSQRQVASQAKDSPEIQ